MLLGKYQEGITAGITAFLIVVAVLAHIFNIGGDLTFVDAAALLALGATYGKQSAANGYARATMAAHKRLDAINAPPADETGPEG